MDRGLVRRKGSTDQEADGTLKPAKADNLKSSKLSLSLASQIFYGADVINTAFIFLTTKTVIGLVDEAETCNLLIKIIPKRKVVELNDLKENEIIDLFIFAQKAITILEKQLGKFCKQVINSGNVKYNENTHCCITIVVLDKDKTVMFGSLDKDGGKGYAGDQPSGIPRSEKIELTNAMRKAIKEMYK